MTYEFITMSDKITFLADDDKIAYATVLLIGNGKAGCTREDGESIPTMLMFDRNATETAKQYLGEDIDTFIDTNQEKVAECLLSFAYIGFGDREYFDKALAATKDEAERKEFLTKHENDKRTSMSKWVAYAWKLGGKLLAQAKEKPAKTDA